MHFRLQLSPGTLLLPASGMLPARSRVSYTCSSCRQPCPLPLTPPCWGVVPPNRHASRIKTHAQDVKASQQAKSEAVRPLKQTLTDRLDGRLQWELCLLLATLPAGPALAEDALAYNPEGGSQLIKALSGFGYVALLGYFLFKILNRRARTAREEVG